MGITDKDAHDAPSDSRAQREFGRGGGTVPRLELIKGRIFLCRPGPPRRAFRPGSLRGVPFLCHEIQSASTALVAFNPNRPLGFSKRGTTCAKIALIEIIYG